MADQQSTRRPSTPTFGKGGELLELETVARAIDEAALHAGNVRVRQLRDATRYCIAYMDQARPIESPIEAIFYAWFCAIESLEDGDVYRFDLIPQSAIKINDDIEYRVDFQIWFGPQELSNQGHYRKVPQPKLAVELDGHDFHERTKEQVVYRNQRDRDLLAAGWTVLHFSGSELYRDPLQCATQVLEMCHRMHEPFMTTVYAAPKSTVEP